MKRYLLPLFILVVAAVVSTTLSVPSANRMVVEWNVPAINRVVAALDVPLTGWTVVALFSIALVVFGTLHILIELIFKRETYLMRSPLSDLRRSMVDLAKRPEFPDQELRALLDGLVDLVLVDVRMRLPGPLRFFVLSDGRYSETQQEYG